MLITLLWLPILILVSAPCVMAQSSDKSPAPATPEPVLEPVVVTASREPAPLDINPNAITLISRAEIENMHYPNVLEALRGIPGMHVDQPGGAGSRASIYLRGLDPNHTVVMIDGIRLNDPTNNRGGSFDLSTLSLANVERIEIVRGPLSAVHGSDAIAGAVNVITRRGGETNDFQFDLSGGRFGYNRTMAGAWGKIGHTTDYSLTASFNDEGSLPGEATSSGWHVKGGLGLALPARSRLYGVFRIADTFSKTFPDDSGGQKFAVLRQLEKRNNQEISAKLELTQSPVHWLDYSLSGNYFRRRERDENPGIAPGPRDPFGIPAQRTKNVFDRYALALRITTKIPYGISFSTGGDIYGERGTSRGDLFLGGNVPTNFHLRRFVKAPFAEGSWKCKCGLTFQVASRMDFPDKAGSRVTPRVSAAYRIPTSHAVLSASWGKGFKLPSFFSLGDPIVGNANLRAETSQGFDLGIRHKIWDERLTAGITYFNISVKDLIDFDPGPPPRLVNRSRVLSHGVEVDLEAQPLESLSLKSNLSYNETDIRGSSEQLLNRPRWRGGLSIAWKPLERISITLRGTFVGNVLDSSVPTGRVNLSPYQRFDAAFKWQIHRFATMYLALDNISNSKHEEAVGFPSIGLRPRIGFDVRM